jgi:hypothetical protein
MQTKAFAAVLVVGHFSKAGVPVVATCPVHHPCMAVLRFC